MRLIDFAYAICLAATLRLALPADPDRLDCFFNFYLNAFRQAQVQRDPTTIQLGVSARSNVFSLCRMFCAVVPKTSSANEIVWQRFSQPRAEERARSFYYLAMEGPTARLQALTETLVAQLQKPLGRWDQAAATLSAWSPLTSINPLLKTQTTPALTPLFADLQIPVVTFPIPSFQGAGGRRLVGLDLFSPDLAQGPSACAWLTPTCCVSPGGVVSAQEISGIALALLLCLLAAMALVSFA
jgi:hypothetical protein